ncbi:MAG: TspO/MBR family protein [Cyanobacteria bacterium CRU_2_1]|nr:TspO/MBR family protein [Cyanobacteria bacterium RU_5_0]NJR61040.1 TspO/MBR family protein [Cyanobacteria bacterium CRU_2_1]
MIKPWMVIGGVTLIVALAANLIRPKDIKWFRRLQRPQWLVIEPLIPFIWSVIFICGAWSAHIVWIRNPGDSYTWFLMAFYLLLEIAIVSYTPVMFWTRSLKIGTYIGGIGFILGVILTLLVLPISGWAALLLVPYLLWSPVGTIATWQMSKLNPESA